MQLFSLQSFSACKAFQLARLFSLSDMKQRKQKTKAFLFVPAKPLRIQNHLESLRRQAASRTIKTQSNFICDLIWRLACNLTLKHLSVSKAKRTRWGVSRQASPKGSKLHVFQKLPIKKANSVWWQQGYYTNIKHMVSFGMSFSN